METANNQFPDNLDNSELEVEPPLVLRFHHLLQLTSMERDHESKRRYGSPNGESPPSVGQLYLYPEVVKKIIHEFKESKVKSLREDLEGRIANDDIYESSKEAIEMSRDYAGPKGIGAQRFADIEGDFIEQLLVSDTQRKARMTWGPDVICFGCQSTGPDQPGEHCIRPVNGSAKLDIAFYKGIEYARTLPDVPRDIVEITDEAGRHSFEKSLGTLRSHSFLDAVHGKVREE